ncbi:MAG: hypothetical protein GC151_11190 [Betaproteobacteria bacterium]|nr:hypothetical protein [Betaproteobacteria bacterium]
MRGPGRVDRSLFGRVAFLLCLALLPAIAGAAEGFDVTAARAGRAVHIDARATIRAPYALIWETLTDYDHLSDFIPGLDSSRVLRREGNAAIVAQKGSARFLFFRMPIEVVVESVERPPHDIGIRVLEGDLRQLDGGYRLERIDASGDAFILRWSGTIEPSLSLPFFVSVPLLRSNISAQFLGMVREIERRAAELAASNPVRPES